MKTKIMLAVTLVAAVCLVGMARPTHGAGPSEAVTVLSETALPAPAAPDAVFQETAAAQEKAKTQEKAKAAEKAKEAEKAAKEGAAVEKTIVIRPVGAEGKPIEIVITEGDVVKKLVLEKPLTITKEAGGDILILTSEGKEPLVLKGEPLRIEIKGDEGKTVVFYGSPEGKVAFGRAVQLVKEGEAGTTWTVKEGEKGERDVHIKIAEPVKGFAFARAFGDKDMLKKVQALQEQLQAIKAKKMDLSALEESLKKLETELQAKEEKLRAFELKFDKEPGTFVFKKSGAEETEGKSFAWVTAEAKDKAAWEAKNKAIIHIQEKDDGMISLLFTGQDGEAGQASFERATAALKKALPEGYTLAEQKYDGENGTMTFKLSAPEGKKTDETLVKKLVDAVKSAIDKK